MSNALRLTGGGGPISFARVYDQSSDLRLNEILATFVPSSPNGAAINVVINPGINSIHADAYGAAIYGPGNTGWGNAIGAAGRYSTIAGGYDNEIYGQASHIMSQHGEIQAAADHGVIIGGSYITITAGSYGATIGGTGNTVSANHVFMGPSNNTTVSGPYSISITGLNCTNAGTRCTMFTGISNVFEAGVTDTTILCGNNHTIQAAAAYSLVVGRYVIARNAYEAVVSGPRVGTTSGTKQLRTLMVYGVQTTSATTLNLLPTSGNGRVPVAPNSTVIITANIVARRTNTAEEGAAFVLTAVYRRGALASSIVRIGSDSLVVIGRDDATWTVASSADTSLGNVRISVTGAAGKTIEWAASLEVVEIIAAVA